MDYLRCGSGHRLDQLALLSVGCTVKIIAEIPDDLTLLQLSPGIWKPWKAAFQVKGGLFLQAREGDTPQEAIDLAAEAVRKGAPKKKRADGFSFDDE